MSTETDKMQNIAGETRDALVEACDITVYAGKGKEAIEIVKNASFKAENGELTGICGPNGAGKSTLLRALSGFVPSSGTVKFNNKVLGSYKRKEIAQILSYMHQDTLMPFSFIVRDVVAMGRFPYLRSMSELDKADIAVIDDSMALAGCLDYCDKYVTELSGGERQRVMLARVLAQQTPMIFLDEPTSAQDIRHAEETMSLLRRLSDSGKTIVTVLHDLRLAARYCTKTALMFKGDIVACGDPEEVFHQGHLEYVFHIKADTFRNPAGQWDYFTRL
ncbi:MAG: ABC transporter ATP-binding protein [Eubacteriales bacterium]|nr:ABC transporter ATP-binding protein [Eubacteriales bacterium]